MNKRRIYGAGGVLVVGACAVIVMAQSPQSPKAAVEMAPDGRVKGLYVTRGAAAPAVVTEQDVAAAMTNTTPAPAQVTPPAVAEPKPEPMPAPATAATPQAAAPAPMTQIASPAAPPPEPTPTAVALTLNPSGPKPVMADAPLDKIPEKPAKPENGLITVSAKSKNKADGGKPTVTVSTPNPFDVRFVPVASLDEYQFKITGHLWGVTPLVFVNGKTWAVGDNILGFKVHKIRTDGCIMEKDGNYFFLPAGQKVTIRLPK